MSIEETDKILGVSLVKNRISGRLQVILGYKTIAASGASKLFLSVPHL